MPKAAPQFSAVPQQQNQRCFSSREPRPGVNPGTAKSLREKKMQSLNGSSTTSIRREDFIR
jgi:hypothetical protein